MTKSLNPPRTPQKAIRPQQLSQQSGLTRIDARSELRIMRKKLSRHGSEQELKRSSFSENLTRPLASSREHPGVITWYFPLKNSKKPYIWSSYALYSIYA